ncbi:MAG: glycosyltransferase family 1 protein [Candidatus Aenigmatarchaeota archaeon]
MQNHDWSHGIFSESLRQYISGNIYSLMHKHSCKSADINLSNSKFTAKETKKFCGKESIVIYQDCDPFYKDKNSISQRVNLNIHFEDYILYVGRIYPKYKNISSILYAYNKIHNVYKDLKLILVHTDNYRSDDYKFIKANKLNVIDLKGLPKENVKFLYENALATIYPSLYEGFGFPIVEAQASRSPLIISDKGPMPEVAADSALYFDGSSDDLLEKIQILISDKEKRETLREKGYKNAMRFNWKDTSEKIFKVISDE